MKNSIALCAIVLASSCLVPIACSQSNGGSRVRAQLIDGSHIFGVTPSESIKLKLEFSELTIPLTKVRRVVWKSKGIAARVELLNDDVISGQFASETIPVEALFGKFELRCEYLKSLERLPPESAGAMPIRKGLVAYYSFDHGQESLGADDASEKFRAEVNGARWIKEGKLGGAAEFDGASSLSIPHDNALNFSKGLTLSAWINPNESDRHGYAMIVGKTTGSSWHGGYGLARMSGDTENVYFFVNHYSSSAVKAPVKAGQWSHVVGACDGKVAKIFVNGVAIQSLPIEVRRPKVREPLTTENAIVPVNVPLMLGSDQSGYFWKGKLDETALFDRALTDDEIARLYEAGANEYAAK